MESILARALEYTLKYWLKSYSRDQFKLQGRTVQLSNLDINGDVFHASLGLPLALNVSKAKVGKLEIKLPYVSNVQIEPIIVQIDRLDVVLEEKLDSDGARSSSSNQSSPSSGRGSGYGFADKIADGMTLEVGIVNILLETRGGARCQGGATWASPLASITMRNLSLYTTNEKWQVVNLKEARDFSYNTKYIYVFKKLQWESLSVDLLPHPDMFTEANLTSSGNGASKRDDDGAKRRFLLGERFLEGISGEAYITVQRTEQNSPLGLEVQLHVTEAVCPALSEPGLRALLRFMTGLFVCLNRGDVDPKDQQRTTEAAGCSRVSMIVDHIFLCIKDTEFQLELLMQSLLFSRASVSDGENTRNLTGIMLAGLFLRDTFSRPPCTLVQPSMQAGTKEESLHIPEFAESFCPPIYPLGDNQWQFNVDVPLVCLHSLQIKPSPTPPSFALETVIDCQPLVINLQEETCLRISSFLADGIVVNNGAVLPDFSINSLVFTLKEFDLTVPLDTQKSDNSVGNGDRPFQRSFSGARLHVEDLIFLQSPKTKFRLLNLEKDPACFCLWEDQPLDASQKKWTTRASHISLSLQTCNGIIEQKASYDWSAGLWRCVELNEACFEAAMVTADGGPLITVPPPGGIVRVGVACEQYLSNTSMEQLFFVLDLYTYFGRVSEKIAKVGKSSDLESRQETVGGKLMEKAPSDTAASLAVKELQLKFLESSSEKIHGMPLVQFAGEDLFVKVSHRTLGGAVAVSSNLHWESVQVDCVDADWKSSYGNGTELPTDHGLLVPGNVYPQMRAVFWIDNRRKDERHGTAAKFPFLEISMVHVMPYHVQDLECHSLSVSAKVAGVRLGGGMNYTEALLHRFGILGPDGGPGEGLSKGLKNLSSGPLSKLLRASPLPEVHEEDGEGLDDGNDGGPLELGMPDDVDISIELKDWLFALEGAEDETAGLWTNNCGDISREARCWHTTFQCLQVKAKSSLKHNVNSSEKLHGRCKNSVELVTVSVDGLQALKPQYENVVHQNGISSTEVSHAKKDVRWGRDSDGYCGGLNIEVRMVMSEDEEMEMLKWIVESFKFSVKQPIEAVATREELEHLALLCRSEVDSMGRITAGILRVFKLERSIGQATIRQLSNLGEESLDKIFTPEKLSRPSSICSPGLTPSPNMAFGSPKKSLEVTVPGFSSLSNVACGTPNQSLESTVSHLETAVSESQATCSALIAERDSSKLSDCLSDIQLLSQKLESMQKLLRQLRTQI